MKKILHIFFYTLGVIFFVLILVGVYLFIADPLQIKPLIFGPGATEVLVTDISGKDAHPVLNESQETALEKIGIDPASIPSKITPAQEACFIKILGDSRIAEIKSGALPTVFEYLQVKDCI